MDITFYRVNATVNGQSYTLTLFEHDDGKHSLHCCDAMLDLLTETFGDQVDEPSFYESLWYGLVEGNGMDLSVSAPIEDDDGNEVDSVDLFFKVIEASTASNKIW